MYVYIHVHVQAKIIITMVVHIHVHVNTSGIKIHLEIMTIKKWTIFITFQIYDNYDNIFILLIYPILIFHITISIFDIINFKVL